MISREELINKLKSAVSSNTFLTNKHDPNDGRVRGSFRTVLTQQASGSLQELINSEKYDLEAYYSFKHSNNFYTLLPHDSGSYVTVGLAIPSGSLIPNNTCDTFLIASGSREGWHIYPKKNTVIQSEISTGEVQFLGKL